MDTLVPDYRMPRKVICLNIWMVASHLLNLVAYILLLLGSGSFFSLVPLLISFLVHISAFWSLKRPWFYKYSQIYLYYALLECLLLFSLACYLIYVLLHPEKSLWCSDDTKGCRAKSRLYSSIGIVFYLLTTSFVLTVRTKISVYYRNKGNLF